MNFWKSLSGSLEVELTSAALPEAMAQINALGIEIRLPKWKNELTVTFRIPRRHFRRLKALAEKRGETVSVRRHLGIFWTGRLLLKRPVLTAGFLLFMCLSLYLPGRILWVRVEGNQHVPQNQILEAAESQGVCFGASRREIRSERIKNALLGQIPQLQWAGVNTAGSLAIISVRERTSVAEDPQEISYSQIVAVRDGYILSGNVTRGTPLFQPGQVVIRGQILISGYMDGGFCIRAVRAEGEIMAQTNRNLTAVTPAQCLVRTGNAGVRRKISLLFRKKRINLWKDSGIYDATCGRMYTEYYITLPGGFSLPVGLCLEEYTLRETVVTEQARDTVHSQLRHFSGRYLENRMISGTIRNRSEKLDLQHGLYRLQGQYICEEMIGREQSRQIGEANE